MTAPLHPHSVAAVPFNMAFAVALVVVLFAGMVVAAILLRKFMRDQARANKEDWTNTKTDVENPSAFMAASMQGVIEKLRTQEKELARLHLLAQERAQESERLTEEVTRNMPTGLLLVNATGAISTSNPAAEEALGIRTLRYR
jgi:PAS domain-containing protein